MTYLDKLYTEVSELRAKLVKLESFLKSDQYLVLDYVSQALLKTQVFHMIAYVAVLDRRIEHEETIAL